MKDKPKYKPNTYYDEGDNIISIENNWNGTIKYFESRSLLSFHQYWRNDELEGEQIWRRYVK